MKKLRRLIAIVTVLGFGVGTAACTSPVAPDTNDNIDFGSGSIDFGSGSIDFGSGS